MNPSTRDKDTLASAPEKNDEASCATAPNRWNFTGPELLSSDALLTPEECIAALETFREQVIRPSIPDWDVNVRCCDRP